MAAVLLDSTVVIDVLKDRPTTVARFLALEPAGDIPHVCAVTVEEVTSGLHPNERERASALFAGLSVAPLGMAEGRLAGWWRRRYRGRGRTLSQADARIAGTAGGPNASPATCTPNDYHKPEVTVEHWPVGE